MLLGFFLPLLIGTLGVLQNTLNRLFAGTLGLGAALLVNGLVLAACGIFFFWAVRFLPPDLIPAMYRPLPNARPFAPYDLIPGLFGFVIIASMPWAIEKMGATRVFVGVIAAQIIVSILWDLWVERIGVNMWRLIGAGLALLGTALASL